MPQSGTKTGNGITLEFVSSEQALRFSNDAGANPDADHSFGGSPGSFPPGDWEVRIDVATMRVSQIDVVPATEVDCDAVLFKNVECLDDRYRISESIELDLLTGMSEPNLEEYRFPPGEYDSVEVSLAVPSGDDSEGAALRFSGVVEFGGEPMPFEFEVSEARGLTFTSLDGTSLDIGTGSTLQATLDLGRLFELNPPNCVVFGSPLGPTSPADVCQPSGDDLLSDLQGSTELSRGRN